MEDFDYTLSINGEQIPVTIHPHIENDSTWYDIIFNDHTISIYKDTLYTWSTDYGNGLSAADIQSIGEQIQDVI